MRKHSTGRDAVVPVGAALAVMVFWGATPIVTRLALEDLGPLEVACLRTVIAGAVAAPLLARRQNPIPAGRVSRKLLLLSAVVGFVVFPVVYTIGQQRTSALHGVMILAVLVLVLGDHVTMPIAFGGVLIVGGIVAAQRA